MMPRMSLSCHCMGRLRTVLTCTLLTALFLNSGCTTQLETSVSRDIPEIRPGILLGYLAESELPDSLRLLSPPPEQGSVGFALDQYKATQFVDLDDEARQAQAVRDSVLSFPEATEAFNGVLPVSISLEQTPHVYMILRRTLADVGLSTYGAKNHYQRERPFMVNQTPTLTPDEEEHLRKDGSYPSGHTAVGWAWALDSCGTVSRTIQRHPGAGQGIRHQSHGVQCALVQ